MHFLTLVIVSDNSGHEAEAVVAVSCEHLEVEPCLTQCYM